MYIYIYIYICVCAYVYYQLASALMLAFGITAKANPGAIATVFNYLLPAATRTDLQNTGVDISGIVVSNAAFMIIIGVVGLVIAGFGFIGAFCLIKWMLVIVRSSLLLYKIQIWT